METDANVAEAQEQHRGIPADTFRARLRLARLHAGDLTIRQAAERAGVNHASWANWEKGMEPRDKVEIVEAISETFDIDFLWLLRGGPLAREARRRHDRHGRRKSAARPNEGSTRRAGRRHAAIKATTCAPPTVRGDADQPGTRRPQRVFAHRTDTAA